MNNLWRRTCGGHTRAHIGGVFTDLEADLAGPVDLPWSASGVWECSALFPFFLGTYVCVRHRNRERVVVLRSKQHDAKSEEFNHEFQMFHELLGVVVT